MQLSQFDLFCQVARVKSFSKAAKLMHLSQPAISSQISSMEDYYGIKLFERTPQGVVLTPAGDILYEYAQQILDQHIQLERKLASMADEINQKLVIGATPTVGNHALACGIWTFTDKYPELKLCLEIGNVNEIMVKLQDSKIDLAIVECPVPDCKSFSCRKVFTDELVAIVPNNEKWAGKTSITIEELCQDRLILMDESSELRYILDHILAPLELSYRSLKPHTIIGNFNAIVSAIEKGYGVSLCLRLNIQRELKHGKILSLEIDGIQREVDYQVVYKEISLSAIAKRFLRVATSPGELEVC